MKHVGGNKYRLTTGRELDASADGYIGLNADMRVGLGYDHGAIEITPRIAEDEGIELDPEDCWTADERAELADFMIAQWQAFKATAKEQG